RRDAAEAQAADGSDGWWSGPEQGEPSEEELRISDLVERGADYRDAYAEVHNMDSDLLARQDRQAVVNQERLPGETLDDTVRRMYHDFVNLQFMEAEAATNGVMLNKAGLAAGVSDFGLFSGPARIAYTYASEELKRWWVDHPRVTWTEYAAEALGRDSLKRRARLIGEGYGGMDFMA
ncbi:MAG: hypothetical protein JWP34_4800, partial [Massilia sp.]|nr:hypothetical protein [Massilia sp.]